MKFNKIFSAIIITVISLNFFIQCKDNNQAPHQASERFKIGWEKLKEIDGDAGERVIESLQDISPDLGKFIIEYAFGDIYSRAGLDLKTKELCVISALAAMGTAEPQLKVHINGALNVGNSKTEVIEAFLHTSVYYGFPAALNAVNATKEVFEERIEKGVTDTESERYFPIPSNPYNVGIEWLNKLKENQANILKDNYSEVAPEILKYIIEYAYGEIISRPVLTLRERELMTIAMLTAIGNASSQLKFHIEGALNIGCSKEEIKEVMLLMTVYAGFPAAINGITNLKKVLITR